MVLASAIKTFPTILLAVNIIKLAAAVLMTVVAWIQFCLANKNVLPAMIVLKSSFNFVLKSKLDFSNSQEAIHPFTTPPIWLLPH